jgi:hypothetical protein
MADEQEVFPPERDILNKLSAALTYSGIARGDPIIALRNEFSTQLRSLETRFEAFDKATDLAHEDMVRVPTQVQTAVGSLRELLEQLVETKIAEIRGELNRHAAETAQKFHNVDGQFTERDTRTDQRAGDTKLAVDAAFAAAKEATAKIEAGFTKQIDGQGEIIDTKTGNLASSISDLKDRLVTIESRGVGRGDVVGWVVGGVGLMAVVLTAVYAMHPVAAIQPAVQYVPAPTATPAPITVPR